MDGWDVSSIEQADERLLQWLQTVLKGLHDPPTCTLDKPPANPTDQGVSCYLLRFDQQAILTQVNHPSLQLTLYYLVTSWASTPQAAHTLLGAALAAALQDGVLEVDFTPPDSHLWSDLHTTPQPSFFLRVLVRLERPAPKPARLVSEPLKVAIAPLVSLNGMVIGPGDQPIMDALVELPLLQLTTRSGADGRFYFPAIPGEGKTHLRIYARGQEMDLQVDKLYAEDDPLKIRFVIPPL